MPTRALPMKKIRDLIRLKYVVFPRWQADAGLSLDRLSGYEGLKHPAMNAFNYDTHGDAGFATLKAIVDNSQCFRLRYSKLG